MWNWDPHTFGFVICTLQNGSKWLLLLLSRLLVIVIVSQLLAHVQCAGSTCVFPLIRSDSKVVANSSGNLHQILNFRKMYNPSAQFTCNLMCCFLVVFLVSFWVADLSQFYILHLSSYRSWTWNECWPLMCSLHSCKLSYCRWWCHDDVQFFFNINLRAF